MCRCPHVRCQEDGKATIDLAVELHAHVDGNVVTADPNGSYRFRFICVRRSASSLVTHFLKAIQFDNRKAP